MDPNSLCRWYDSIEKISSNKCQQARSILATTKSSAALDTERRINESNIYIPRKITSLRLIDSKIKDN